MTARRSRVLVAVLLALALAACFTIGSPTLPHRPPPARQTPERRSFEDSTSRSKPELERKPVHGKTEPNMLLAKDGTVCTVSRDKYERTIIGTSLWCIWTDPDR